MPHKIKTGWKWANVKRKTKGELAKTVYGIWKKNGSKGDFSDFWHRKDNGENTNESEVLSPGETISSVNGLKTINNSRIGSEHMNAKTVKSPNATQTIDEGYFDSTEEINTHDEQLPEPPEEVEVPNEMRGNYKDPELTPVYNAWSCVNYLYRNRGARLGGVEGALREYFREIGGNILNPQVDDGAINVGNGDLDDKGDYEIAKIALDNLESAYHANPRGRIFPWAIKQIQHMLETGTVTPESITNNATTLVESWGTPWQRISSEI